MVLFAVTLTALLRFLMEPAVTHWPLLLVVAVAGAGLVVQGLIGLANQNALYRQADPDRLGSSAGLLRTFMYLGAMLAAAANAAAFPDRAAHEHGYHVTLATDAMTDLDAASHESSVTRIFPRLGETATTDEVLALLP